MFCEDFVESREKRVICQDSSVDALEFQNIKVLIYKLESQLSIGCVIRSF